MIPYLILAAVLIVLALLTAWCLCRIAAWTDKADNRPISGNNAPSCPRCGVDRPWGPQHMVFPDGGTEEFWRCRSCGREYWGRDVAPGRCWGVGV